MRNRNHTTSPIPDKIEVTIDIIVHATEDFSRILQPLKLLGLKEEDFALRYLTGHFDNPICLLNARIVKEPARNFMKRFLGRLSDAQINELVEEIGERTVNSRFHVRLEKQELISGKLVFGEGDAVKLKIHTPVYNKRDTVKVFTEIFRTAN